MKSMHWRATSAASVFVLASVFASASAHAGARVAVIDEINTGAAQGWCNYLVQFGHQCTVFPVTGPTSSLDPFTVLIDLSEVWADPDNKIADFLRAGKGVILWKNAPYGLGLNANPTVQAWVGMSHILGSEGHMETITTDPVIGPYEPGFDLCDCWEPCTAFTGPIGNVKLIGEFFNPNTTGAFGMVRNEWEGGKSVYLPQCITPPIPIVLNAVREMDSGIPTVSLAGTILMMMSLVCAGCLLLHRARRLASLGAIHGRP